MPVIDSQGLLKGARLRRCSPRARLFWPFIYAMSNGFNRIEIDPEVVAGALITFKDQAPPIEQVEAFFAEYTKNNLLFEYNVRAARWGQWDTRRAYQKRYKTTDDKRSPAPPEPAYTEWLKMLHGDAWMKFHNGLTTDRNDETEGNDPEEDLAEGSSRDSLENFPKPDTEVRCTGNGIGIGNGIGKGNGKGDGLGLGEGNGDDNTLRGDGHGSFIPEAVKAESQQEECQPEPIPLVSEFLLQLGNREAPIAKWNVLFTTLVSSHNEDHVRSTMAYCFRNERWCRGARTVRKMDSCEWFVARFEDIARCLNADQEYATKRKQNAAAAGKEGLPQYRQEAGKKVKWL